MCFRFQGDDTLDVLYLEIVGLGVVCRSKLFDNRTFGKGYIVFVGRDNLLGFSCVVFFIIWKSEDSCSTPSMMNVPPKICDGSARS